MDEAIDQAKIINDISRKIKLALMDIVFDESIPRAFYYLALAEVIISYLNVQEAETCLESKVNSFCEVIKSMAGLNQKVD